MKRIILAFIFATLALTFSVNAQQTNTVSKSETEFEILKDQYQKLLNQQVELEKERAKITTELKEEREKYLNFMELIIGICGGILVLLGTIASFLGWSTRSDLKKQLDERKNELAIQTQEFLELEKKKLIAEADKKLEDLTDRLTWDVARLLEQNPSAVNSLIKSKLSSFEAKENNPILLYHKADDKIDTQLRYYGFKVIDHVEFDEERIPLKIGNTSNASVVFIVDPTEYKESIKNTPFCESLKPSEHLERGANYFYLGAGRFPESKDYTSNFARTPSTVYQNMLDLLRYIEFKKSDKKG